LWLSPHSSYNIKTYLLRKRGERERDRERERERELGKLLEFSTIIVRTKR